MILLDTTFLIDLLKERKNAVDKAVELVVRDSLATTNINIYELLIGIFSIKDIDYGEKLRDAEKLFDRLNVLNLDRLSAIKAAKIGGELMQKGQMIGDTDNIIAGIAIANKIDIIITRDKEHFSRVKGIKAEGY